MSNAPRRANARPPDHTDGIRRWTGAVLTMLLHALLVLLVMLSPPITVTPPQESAAGSRMEVTYIDDTLSPPPPTTAPQRPKPAPAARPKTAPKATRVQTTPTPQAADAVLPDAATTPDTPTPSPPDVPDETAPQQTAQAPAASPPPMRRSNPMYGQPPGMLPDDVARANAGRANSPALDRGRRNRDSSGGPALEVDGYQVYYELVSDIRLRAWREQGMTELFLPLPGTRRIMVCPLEVALRRGSGKCRMVEPDSPELAAIGDARLVLNMQRVYKLGDVVWRGPGPYR